MTDTKLNAFGPDAALTLSGLTIETDATMLAIYGSIDIKRDKKGLSDLTRLKAIIDEAHSDLSSDHEIPDVVPDRSPGEEVDNPFQ